MTDYASDPIFTLPASDTSAKFGQRHEMVIGFGNWGFLCAVAAFHALAALDPAYGVDVMIVALRAVQCVVQAVTVAAVD